MGSGISPKELVWCSGCGLFLWVLILSASRRLIVCQLLSARRGFFLLASLLSVPLGLLIRVVVLSFSAPHCLWLTLGVMSRVVIYRLNFLFLASPFVSFVCRLPTATLRGISSLTSFILGLIPRSLQFFVGTLMRFLTVLWIVLAVACPLPRVTALPHLNFFSMTVVSSISGGTSTLPLPVLPGLGGMAVWRPVLIFLVCRFRGCLLFLHVILSLVLFRTIVVCVSRSRSPMLFPLVRAFGSSTLLFLMTRSMLP